MRLKYAFEVFWAKNAAKTNLYNYVYSLDDIAYTADMHGPFL